MAASPSKSVLRLGGKSNHLTSAAVFSFFAGRSVVKIDSSSAAAASSQSATTNQYQFQIPNHASPLVLRASQLVLLNKLVRDPKFSAAERFADELSRNDTYLRVFENVTADDAVLINGSWNDAVSVAVLALLDYSASALSVVADAIAAVSSEALNADVSGALNLTPEFSDKDCVAVAGDLKVLLNGSKMLGGKLLGDVCRVPKFHGRLRSVARAVHAAARVELNSTKGHGDGVGEDLLVVLSPLALALKNVGYSSRGRARDCVEKLNGANLFSSLLGNFNSQCPSLDSLDKLILSSLPVVGDEDDNVYVQSAYSIYSLFELVSKILSWEATLAFLIIEGNELVQTSQGSNVNGEDGKPAKKKDKKKMVMGKGTTVLMQFVKDRLGFDVAKVVGDSAMEDKLAQDFLTFFDIKDPGFESLLLKVKEIVDSNESRRLPKLPKGTRDFAREQMTIRERAFSIIGEVFKRHGATALDTPVFELRETLTGKYGEESKLIYDLADQGGELCSLRYDLTVPFARYLAMNGLTSFRRYQIAKVYRRDNPSKGRYREFYQCDFDIAGDETVGADFEVIRILTELLDELNIGDYEIKLNHRKLLDGMLNICGVPADKVRTICSSIDKLDKQSFEQIKREMVEEKGLDVETADKIGSYVKQRGQPLELLNKLKQEGGQLLENSASSDALKDLQKLFEALENGRCIGRVVFDLSLARGLDYYTGVIYEAVFKGATQVGSIAAGGRYDNLIGMFGTKQVPAIGVSLGIERVFTIMEQLQNQAVRANQTQVLVSLLVDDIPLAARLVSRCWDTRIKAEFFIHKRMDKHTDRVKGSKIPLWVIVGEREINDDTVKVKDMERNEEIEIPTALFVDELLRRLNELNM